MITGLGEIQPKGTLIGVSPAVDIGALAARCAYAAGADWHKPFARQASRWGGQCACLFAIELLPLKVDSGMKQDARDRREVTSGDAY